MDDFSILYSFNTFSIVHPFKRFIRYLPRFGTLLEAGVMNMAVYKYSQVLSQSLQSNKEDTCYISND